MNIQGKIMTSQNERENKTNFIEEKNKKERLDIRLPKNQKDLFEHVASIQGRSLTDFIIKAALDAATQEVERNQFITLSMENHRKFVEAIDNPREPSENIKTRYKKYLLLKEKSYEKNRRAAV